MTEGQFLAEGTALCSVSGCVDGESDMRFMMLSCLIFSYVLHV